MGVESRPRRPERGAPKDGERRRPGHDEDVSGDDGETRHFTSNASTQVGWAMGPRALGGPSPARFATLSASWPPGRILFTQNASFAPN